MERNRPHEIDDRAMAIFCNLKPVDLVVSELHPDYAKDYLVEICEHQEMTGEEAHIQLKGKESLVPSQCGTHFSYPLERKHAVYYADRVKLPVFLVLVNVKTSTAYWLFLQRYLNVDLRGKRWRHKRTVTVHVPVANILGSGPSFLDAIKEARIYMAAHQPAAIKAALLATKNALESLDPRFAISITATEHGEHRSVNAKDVVNITLGFAGNADETAKKIEDLFGRGLPIDIAPGEVTITGSPLFEEIFKHGGTLLANRKIDATAVLIARDATDAPVAHLDGLQATVQGGPNEMRIETSLPDAPLLLRNTWTPETTKATVSFNINRERWHNQPVLHLAYFDQLTSFAEAAKGCASMRLEISYRGNFCLGGTFQLNNHKMPDEMYGYLRFVARARDIAKHFGINPLLPAELTREHLHEVRVLHAFIAKRELRQSVGLQPFSFTTEQPCWDVVEETILKDESNGTGVPFVIGNNDRTATLFGCEFPLGEVDLEFTNVIFSDEEKRMLQTRLAGSRSGPLKFRFTTSDDCELIMRPSDAGMEHR